MNLPPFPIEYLDLPDEELGVRLLSWWIGYQAEIKGISLDALTPEIAESIRVATLGMDTDDPQQAALEKTLRRVAGGDTGGGGKLFRQLMHDGAMRLAITDEAKTGRRKQSAIGRKPRKRKPGKLNTCIEKYLRQNPKANWKIVARHVADTLGKSFADKVEAVRVSRIRKKIAG